MALIECEKCHKFYTDKIPSCPHCGFERYSEMICPECGAQISPGAKNCSQCGLVFSRYLSERGSTATVSSVDVNHNVIISVKKPRLTNRTKKIGALCILAFIICACVFGAHNFRVNQYTKQVDLLEAGKVEEVQIWLQKHKFAYKYKELHKQLDEAFVKAIDSAMESGNYVRAQDLLDCVPYLENYEEIRDYLMFESLALSAAVDVRTIYKNPGSLQFISVEFYENPFSPYPYCVASCSGQNGFGGYSSDYSYFTYVNGSYSFQGSCDYLSPTLNDDISDMMVAFEIQGIMAHDKIGVVDISRLNRVLMTNQTIRIDLSRYSLEIKTTV